MRTLDDLRGEKQQLEADIETAEANSEMLAEEYNRMYIDEYYNDAHLAQIESAIRHLHYGIRQARVRIREIDSEIDPGPCFQNRCPYCERPLWLDQEIIDRKYAWYHMECWLEAIVPEEEAQA